MSKREQCHTWECGWLVRRPGQTGPEPLEKVDGSNLSPPGLGPFSLAALLRLLAVECSFLGFCLLDRLGDPCRKLIEQLWVRRCLWIIPLYRGFLMQNGVQQ